MNTEILCKLRPWQIEPAKHLLEILRTHDSALDCSDTGTGKTFVALAIAKSLQLPTLAIVPKIAISGWLEVARHFDEPISVINYELLRTGRTLFGTWSNNASMRAGRPALYVCVYCQRRHQQSDLVIPCPANANGIHCVEHKPRPKSYGDFRWNPAVKMVIFDECHRCSGLKSLNAGLLIAAKRQRIKHLLLSATPAQTILQMKAIGYSLDLFTI